MKNHRIPLNFGRNHLKSQSEFADIPAMVQRLLLSPIRFADCQPRLRKTAADVMTSVKNNYILSILCYKQRNRSDISGNRGVVDSFQ